MFKLAIKVCFENHFGLIHAIFLLLGLTKSVYFFLGHPVQFARSLFLIKCLRLPLSRCGQMRVRWEHLENGF